MASEYFAERREVGVINIGGEGVVTVDAKRYDVRHADALYIGRGARQIVFSSATPTTPAQFYFVSYPAHAPYPTRHVPFESAQSVRLGSQRDANLRTINKLIHPGAFTTCQLVMGLTRLEEGSVWNTMPPHTHQRRSEVYMYFDLPSTALVFHFMGAPGETRHIVVRNGQAVLSPSWSIHTGVATQAYSFIWAMGGENQVFDDMDGVETSRIG
jgi:4-deoxy-L-threo-5-hexosulose-uronate ketol-isomerase